MVLLLLWLAFATYEAPQIWAVDGVSLAYSRQQIDQALGPAVESRPLKVSYGGETWEYTWRNGLKGAFVDRDPGRHPRLLVGRRFTSRGRSMFAPGQNRAQVQQGLGGPANWETAAHLIYFDEGRQAYLSVYFVDDRSVEIVLSRFKLKD